MDARFVLQVLGQFRVLDRASGMVVPIRSRKARALTALLALSGRDGASRERGIGLLWSDRGEEQARASLRQTLTELRRTAIGASGSLLVKRESVAFAAGAVTTDLDEIALLAAEADIATLAAILTDVQPDLLAGLDGIDPAYDDWLRIERERRSVALVNMLLATCPPGGPRAELQDRQLVLSALQRLEPGDERILRRAIELDHEAGDHATLHRRYRSFEKTFAREFVAELSTETVALFKALTTVAPVQTAAPAVASLVPTSNARSGGSGNAAPSEPPVVVIVPLQPTSDASDERLAAQVCQAELEIALSGIADLRLLSLLEDSPADLAAASAHAVSGYVLRGWLQSADGRLRLKWLLLRIRDGLLVWSGRFEIGRDEVGAALDEVVARVAGAVLPAVERDLQRDLPRRSPQPSGYDLYFEGRTLMLSDGGLDDMKRAADLFEQAIAREPRLVNAQMSLAQLYNTDYRGRIAGHDPAWMRARAFELCARAVTIEPGSARAQSRMGWCYLRRGEIAQAARRFAEAVRLSPYHADCLNEAGFGLLHLGHHENSLALLARAFELNPFPNSDYFADMGMHLMLTGDHARSEEHFELAGATDIHYRVFRMANRALMNGYTLPREPADPVMATLETIWQGPRPPDHQALFETVLAFVPLQREEDQAILARGLTLAGWQIDQARVAPAFN